MPARFINKSGSAEHPRPLQVQGSLLGPAVSPDRWRPPSAPTWTPVRQLQRGGSPVSRPRGSLDRQPRVSAVEAPWRARQTGPRHRPPGTAPEGRAPQVRAPLPLCRRAGAAPPAAARAERRTFGSRGAPASGGCTPSPCPDAASAATQGCSSAASCGDELAGVAPSLKRRSTAWRRWRRTPRCGRRAARPLCRARGRPARPT
mmetsp:Transcript_104603/g.312443  ORF Transcript_104603/g.312443 Transcript_104603/m.312443 type:complete len:203 (+) Transcript_104603:2-610(+)